MDKEIIINRIGQLIEKANKVKATHKPNPPGVIGFPTLDSGMFHEWKSGCENLIIKVAGKESIYYNNFVKTVKYAHEGHVNSGMGMLRALKEDIESDVLEINIQKKESEEPIKVKEYKNYWNYVNPIWLLWKLLLFAWKYKIISFILVIVSGLIVAYISYKFGWTR